MEERVCYARRGPFLVSRSGNTYRCIKYTAFNSKVGVSLIYATQARTFKKEPSICDVCSGRYSPLVIVAKGQNYELARQMISGRKLFTLHILFYFFHEQVGRKIPEGHSNVN
ncbi:uncharacterized protein [Mytilus edulis]|uniref:uncharacterized protein n=1 Tax=Mytilus edulis TaxID=6550 RepID=UPI0039F0AD23